MSGGITVIGSSNVDMIMRLDHLPAVGETVTEGEFALTYGGKGANQAVGAARAGGDVTFVTCLGSDHHAQELQARFQQDGIRTDFIRFAENTPTGSALIMFDQRGDNYLAVAPGANGMLTPDDIRACESLIAESRMVLLQMEIPIATIECALELAARHRTPTLFNYAPVRQKEIIVSERMTGLVVNEVEAEALTGRSADTPERAFLAAEALRERGPQFVVLTLGRAGACLIAEGVQEAIPAFPVTPVDTTAAGDVFCGALAVAIVEGKALPEATRFASAAAALSVTRLGAQPSAPPRAEVEAFLESRQHG